MTPTDRVRTDRFERLYRSARDPLAAYLARRASPDVVEDLFADVMTIAWRRLDSIPDEAAVPWLYGVARRVLANHRRAGGRFGRLLERLMLVERSVDHGFPVRAGGDTDLAAALATLSDADAEILRLWAWEELAAADIAAVLGISSNAASIRLHRAKGRLRTRLDEDPRKRLPRAGHQPGVERKEAR